jgi:curved DNA-binding protein CbpA
MDGFEPCRVLGVAPDCEDGELKAAYRYLAKKYHPDASGDPGTGERFALVVKAYKVLDVRSKLKRPRPDWRPRAWSRIEAGADLFSLGSVALSASEPELRRAAVRRLGFTGKKAAFVFLRRALADVDEGVVAAAVRAAADLSAFQASDEIAALWLRSSPALKRLVLDVAETTGEALFGPALAIAASEGGPEAARARRWLHRPGVKP